MRGTRNIGVPIDAYEAIGRVARETGRSMGMVVSLCVERAIGTIDNSDIDGTAPASGGVTLPAGHLIASADITTHGICVVERGVEYWYDDERLRSLIGHEVNVVYDPANMTKPVAVWDKASRLLGNVPLMRAQPD